MNNKFVDLLLFTINTRLLSLDIKNQCSAASLWYCQRCSSGVLRWLTTVSLSEQWASVAARMEHSSKMTFSTSVSTSSNTSTTTFNQMQKSSNKCESTEYTLFASGRSNLLLCGLPWTFTNKFIQFGWFTLQENFVVCPRPFPPIALSPPYSLAHPSPLVLSLPLSFLHVCIYPSLSSLVHLCVFHHDSFDFFLSQHIRFNLCPCSRRSDLLEQINFVVREKTGNLLVLLNK